MKMYESKQPKKIRLSEEDVNVSKVISDLIDTKWSGSNEDQGRAVALMKGLAFSDSPLANKFMKAMDDFTSGLNKADFQ
jgi:hypothetical protein